MKESSGIPPGAKKFGLRCAECADRYGLDLGPDDFIVIDGPDPEVWTRCRDDRASEWLRLDFSPRFPTSLELDLPQRDPSYCDHNHSFQHVRQVYLDAAFDAIEMRALRGVVMHDLERDLFLDEGGLVRSRPKVRDGAKRPRPVTGASSTRLAETGQVMELLRGRSAT